MDNQDEVAKKKKEGTDPPKAPPGPPVETVLTGVTPPPGAEPAPKAPPPGADPSKVDPADGSVPPAPPAENGRGEGPVADRKRGPKREKRTETDPGAITRAYRDKIDKMEQAPRGGAPSVSSSLTGGTYQGLLRPPQGA